MKIKCQPSDFQVEELPQVRPQPRGPYRYYRLTKTGLGTPEAIQILARRWNLAGQQIRYGGLKDRHARTIQYLTIRDGPDHSLLLPNLELEPLGCLDQAYGPGSFRGNRFTLVLRDMEGDAADAALAEIEAIGREGLPNYFDDQRFGSVGYDGGFIGAAWMQGRHDEALRLALAAPNPMDRPEIRKEKAILRDHWPDWAAAKAALPRSSTRSIVTYLVDHPEDFKGAFARTNRDLRSIWFSAFQSHLWNLLLAQAIREQTRDDQRAEYRFKVATMPIFHGLDAVQAARLKALELPLPASRTPRPDGELGEWAARILEPFGLAWEDLRVKGLKDVFLSKGSRRAVFVPDAVTGRREPDELYPRRHAVTLTFELPRGAYATMLVKRLTAGREDEGSGDERD
jgi:tRNA pseudouridine13 synthase